MGLASAEKTSEISSDDLRIALKKVLRRPRPRISSGGNTVVRGLLRGGKTADINNDDFPIRIEKTLHASTKATDSRGGINVVWGFAGKKIGIKRRLRFVPKKALRWRWPWNGRGGD